MHLPDNLPKNNKVDQLSLALIIVEAIDNDQEYHAAISYRTTSLV